MVGTGARRLAPLLSPKLAQGATSAWQAVRSQGLFARRFSQPASNEEEYKRFASAKERAHITVRRRPECHFVRGANQRSPHGQWPEFCNRQLASVDPEMVRRQQGAGAWVWHRA